MGVAWECFGSKDLCFVVSQIHPNIPCRQVVVATVQTASGVKRLDKLSAGTGFGLCIVASVLDGCLPLSVLDGRPPLETHDTQGRS